MGPAARGELAGRRLRRLPGPVRRQHQRRGGGDRRNDRCQRRRQVDAVREGDRRAGAGDPGSISFAGHDLAGVPSNRRVALGVSLVPEGRRIFPSLSVEENLDVGAHLRPRGGPWTTETVYEIFPLLRPLATRSAARLSGGEQQALAIEGAPRQPEPPPPRRGVARAGAGGRAPAPTAHSPGSRPAARRCSSWSKTCARPCGRGPPRVLPARRSHLARGRIDHGQPRRGDGGLLRPRTAGVVRGSRA